MAKVVIVGEVMQRQPRKLQMAMWKGWGASSDVRDGQNVTGGRLGLHGGRRAL